jgi:hypothetical protein
VTPATRRNAQSNDARAAGAVFVMTNAQAESEIISFRLDADGSLREEG